MYYQLGTPSQVPRKRVYLENQTLEYQKQYDELKEKVNELTKNNDELSLQMKEYDEISKSYDRLFKEKLDLLKEKDDHDLVEIDRLIARSKSYTKLLQYNKYAIRLTNQLSGNSDDIILFYDTYSNLHFKAIYSSMNNVMNNHYNDFQQLCVRIEGMSSNMEDTYKELENTLISIDELLDSNLISDASNQKVIEYLGSKMTFSIDGKYSFVEKMNILFSKRQSEFKVKQNRIERNMESIHRWRKYASNMIQILIDDIVLYSIELNKIENRLDQLVMKEYKI